MKYPSCESLLVMAERQGVEIDYYPKCRVWLDKGELNKIIEKSTAVEGNQQLKQNDEKRKQQEDDNQDDDGFSNRSGRNNDSNNPNRKPGGFFK